MKLMVFVGACFVLIASVTESFLLEDNCLAPPPCECANSFVYCISQSLYKIPAFLPAHKTIPTLMVNLRDNFLRVIHDNDFQILQTTQSSSISLNLGENFIEIIEEDAFVGIEKVVRILYLDNNLLEYLPPAVGTLVNLSELSIAYNNMKTFDPNTFAGFGVSLEYLFLNIDTLVSWPTAAFNQLQRLTILEIDDTHLVNWTIPANAMDNVKNTMTSFYYNVYLADNSLSSIPPGLPRMVCNMNRLRSVSLYLDYSVTQDGTVFSESCSTVMSSLEALTLFRINNINITEIFTVFPSLTILNLKENKISNFQLAEYNKGLLKMLALAINELPMVPDDINKLTSLDSLDLANNQIGAIEDDDFSALILLDFLDLQYNLIQTISPNAFQNNNKLTVLHLKGNRMTMMPTLVTMLPSLNLFSFSYGYSNEFNCSCSTLANFASWNLDGIYFTNYCTDAAGLSNGVKVKSYIQNNLKSCP